MSLNIFDNDSVQSTLKFTKEIGGYEMHFMNNAATMLSIRKYGAIVPAFDNVAYLGEASSRFSKFYGHAMSLSSLGVFSDNTTAKNNGLQVGDFYRTSTGQVMVVF